MATPCSLYGERRLRHSETLNKGVTLTGILIVEYINSCGIMEVSVDLKLTEKDKWPGLAVRPARALSSGSPCAKPQVGIEGEPGDPVIFEIDCQMGRRHLPSIRARRVA